MRRPWGVFSRITRKIGDVGIVLHRLANGFGGMGEFAILRQTVLRIAVGAGTGAAFGGAVGQRFLDGGVRGRRLFLHHRLGAASIGTIFAHHFAAEDAARTGHGLGDGLGRKIVSYAAFLFGGGGGDKPHQQEEGHHRGDEVRIGDFPGAAVMAAMSALLKALDNDRVIASHDTPTCQRSMT